MQSQAQISEKELSFEWEQRESSTPYSKHMIAGCLAGLTEHTVMFPFDNIKTHAQVSINQSFISIVKQLYKEGGIPAFYRGLSIVACGAMPAHAFYFSIYELARVKLSINDERSHPYLFALTGATAAFLHDSIMTPVDMLKQRKQISDLSILQLVKNSVKTEGYSSLFKSFPITYLMNAPLAAILVSSNETLKLHFQKKFKHNFLSYFVCAGTAGAIAATLTTPLDVIKTKLQTQDLYQKYVMAEGTATTSNLKQSGDSFIVRKVKYRDILSTFSVVLKEEGIKGFFRGLGSRIIIFAPSSAISWAAYEQLKRLLIGNAKAQH